MPDELFYQFARSPNGGGSTAPSGGADHRQSPRNAYVHFVWFQRIDAEAVGSDHGVGRSCDVSDGGLGFVTRHALPTGARLFVVLVTPVGRVNAIGSVVHSVPAGAEQHRVGVAIEIVPPTDQAMWANLCGSIEP